MSQRNHALDGTSLALQDALCSHSGEISWAVDVLQIYDIMAQIYNVYGEVGDAPDAIWTLEDRVKELERYLVVDLERHIVTCNARRPFYTMRIQSILRRVQDLLHRHLGVDNGTPASHAGSSSPKDFDHLSAELQASFMEYGFCQSYEVMHDMEEISRHLKTITQRLEAVERAMLAEADNPDMEVAAITELHDAMSQQHGIQQSITEANLAKVQGLYDRVTMKIIKLENNLCSNNLQQDSTAFTRYVEFQKALQEPFLTSLLQLDQSDVINNNMIHPGTRTWMLESVNRWFCNTKKSLYYISAKHGVGKTALVSHLCKLYGADAAASHFFDATEGNAHMNTAEGMIQSLAYGMCKTMPEYLKYLSEKYGSAADGLKSKLGRSWRTTYELLIKEPLGALYRGGGAARKSRRRMLLIDALDECLEMDWDDCKAFLTAAMKDLPPSVCLLVTVRSRHFPTLVPSHIDLVEGIKFEDRSWMTRHIRDIEIYMSSSMGAILSGEDDVEAPKHAMADDYTLQNTVDTLLKGSAGRFDYAITIMETFAKDMRLSGGQFLSSVKKAQVPLRQSYTAEFDNRTGDFASPFRSYRDKEGRSVSVRVMRQSLYPKDKTRVALIRGRHKPSE